MLAEDKTVVSLTYELREKNEEGTLIQKVDETRPFAFLFGSGNVIKGFEENLQGKTTGDNFSFGVPTDEAYGPIREEAVLDLSREIFNLSDKDKESEMLQPGNMIPMRDQDGNPLEGKVLETSDKSVKMDFNHPLAGLDLHFSGSILEVRKATADEISHGHVHGAGGVEH